MGPMRCGASLAVKNMDVGPSAPPIIAIEAASLGANPKKRAPSRVKYIPIWAAAPNSMSFGWANNDEKSVMAPKPRNTIEG